MLPLSQRLRGIFAEVRLLKRSLDFAKGGGTRGALDTISSTGVLLSTFVPTKDTSSSRVAALFD